MMGYHRYLPPHTSPSDPTLTPFCYRALGRRALQAGVMKAFNSWLEHGDDVRKMKKFGGRLLNRKARDNSATHALAKVVAADNTGEVQGHGEVDPYLKT